MLGVCLMPNTNNIRIIDLRLAVLVDTVTANVEVTAMIAGMIVGMIEERAMTIVVVDADTMTVVGSNDDHIHRPSTDSVLVVHAVIPRIPSSLPTSHTPRLGRN